MRENPFSGQAVEDAVAAAQDRSPDWARLPASTPAAIRTLARRCLETDQARRPQTIGEALHAIDGVQARSRRRHLAAAAVAGLLVAAVGTSAWTLRRTERARWARNTAIPQIAELSDNDKYAQAFALAREVQRLVPDDAMLATLWPRFTAAMSLTTTPDGADVYARAYAARDEQWEHLGRTPITDVRLPLGVFNVRIERNGYETQHLAAANPSTLLGNATNRLAAPMVLSLVPNDAGQGMVPVPGGSRDQCLRGLSGNGTQQRPFDTRCIHCEASTEEETGADRQPLPSGVCIRSSGGRLQRTVPNRKRIGR
jgi:hypothetical protein